MKRFLTALSLLLLLSPALQAQRPKVGVVLCGGGAKGAAHVGVLKVLEENNIPIDYIVGTSMGAIVGGLYAIGYSAAELDSLIMAQDWNYVMSDRIPRRDTYFEQRKYRDDYLVRIPFGRGDYSRLGARERPRRGEASLLDNIPIAMVGGHPSVCRLSGLPRLQQDAHPIRMRCGRPDRQEGGGLPQREFRRCDTCIHGDSGVFFPGKAREHGPD